jgi:hypothetical protein
MYGAVMYGPAGMASGVQQQRQPFPRGPMGGGMPGGMQVGGAGPAYGGYGVAYPPGQGMVAGMGSLGGYLVPSSAYGYAPMQPGAMPGAVQGSNGPTYAPVQAQGPLGSGGGGAGGGSFDGKKKKPSKGKGGNSSPPPTPPPGAGESTAPSNAAAQPAAPAE